MPSSSSSLPSVIPFSSSSSTSSTFAVPLPVPSSKKSIPTSSIASSAIVPVHDSTSSSSTSSSTSSSSSSSSSTEIVAVNPDNNLTFWDYKSYNSLMFYPEAQAQIDPDLLAREIKHNNTRISNKYMVSEEERQKQMSALAQMRQENAGVGPHYGEAGGIATPDLLGFRRLKEQGKNAPLGGLTPRLEDMPKVRGYSLLSEPSPRPGVDASPIVTWGEVEEAPILLQVSQLAGQTTPGPQFKIPQAPSREQTGFVLADKVAKKMRDQKKVASERVKAMASPFRSSSALSAVSPAAQELIRQRTARLGGATPQMSGIDMQLRASYSPRVSSGGVSQSGRKPGSLSSTPRTFVATPVLTPGQGRARPPSSSSSSQSSSSRGSSSITDNLLHF
eukprot:GILI01011619.1.p1 GENE.GILI01011619.1~~GILI01011619.1.p1  ORF type:complete len:390 (+),score=69.13 GILI01011619.1:878-2047(+)